MGFQDPLRCFPWTRHGAADGFLDRHIGQKASGGLSLGMAIAVERNVDLPLKATITVPVRFAVSHQDQPCSLALARQRGFEVSRAVEALDLHLMAITFGAEVENRKRCIVESETWNPCSSSPRSVTIRQRRMALWPTIRTVSLPSTGCF